MKYGDITHSHSNRTTLTLLRIFMTPMLLFTEKLFSLTKLCTVEYCTYDMRKKKNNLERVCYNVNL